jgi:molybdate transport system permease protein
VSAALGPLGLSIKVGLGCALLGLPIAVALGLLLARADFFGKSLVSTVIALPLVLPPVVTGYLLLRVFGARGPLAALGVPFTFSAALLAAFVVGLPLYVMTVRIAIEAVDPRYEEVARTLGYSRARAFFNVTLPLALPGVIGGFVLTFARALGEFGATAVLAGNIDGETRTLALAVYSLLDSPTGENDALQLVCISVGLALGALQAFERLNRWQRKRLELV